MCRKNTLTQMCVHTYTQTHMNKHTYTHKHMHTHIHPHKLTHTHIHAPMLTPTHASTHAHEHARTHTHTHTHLLPSQTKQLQNHLEIKNARLNISKTSCILRLTLPLVNYFSTVIVYTVYKRWPSEKANHDQEICMYPVS